MNVMDVSRTLGLVATNGEVGGTIDQEKVLGALAELAEDDPVNADLFHAVADDVRRTRSAGVEVHDSGSLRARVGDGSTTQLRYRSEVADLFTDLAIDVGLRRNHQKLTAVG